jgi:ribosome-binding protein aMBF1 (putative translation factor)
MDVYRAVMKKSGVSVLTRVNLCVIAVCGRCRNFGQKNNEKISEPGRIQANLA